MTSFLKHITLLFCFLGLITNQAKAQVITSNPDFPLATDEITLTFDASQGNGALNNYTGDIYAHTGVLLESSSSTSDWKYTIAGWTENTDKAKLTRISTNTYQFTITPDAYNFYGVPTSSTITHLAFVFRNADGSKVGRNADGSDILVEISDGSFQVKITSPTLSPLFVDYGENLPISATADGATNLKLYVDETEIATADATTITYNYTINNYQSHKIKAVATNGTDTEADSVYYFTRVATTTEEMPANYHNGINITSETTAALVLTAPGKDNVFVYGSFNNWQVDETYMMKRTQNGEKFWLELTNLDPTKIYVYQYLVDEEIYIADPYTPQTVDPNDEYIPATTYANLLPYPTQAHGVAGILQTNPDTYTWKITDFQKPDKTNLVIYELHIRDFTQNGNIKTVTDTLNYLKRLGITAIELMPINEFEGNDSWGYNPSFYFATDKAYGTPNDYKTFIDSCHANGIAVIIDMVLNHSYSQSPFVQLYFDADAGSYGQPTANNPWYNETSPNTSYSWGYDFNHESAYTKALVDSVNSFWINEFKVDGFRFDFTKGFTNTVGDGWAYDQSRINILTRMANEIWNRNPETYVILEHLAENTEEKYLANNNIMLWGNLNNAYAQCMMGYSSESSISWASYKNRLWTSPNLVSYAESHDEERTMYKTFTWGNSNTEYDTKFFPNATKRAELAALFHIPIPGPKMIWQFQELGYDISIDENGRVGRKPIHWEYNQNPERHRIYNMYRILNQLKRDYPTFKTSDFDLIDNGLTKKLYLLHPDMDVIIIGNFDLTEKTITVNFTKTGTWFNYFENSEINVQNTEMDFTLAPGEYKLLSSKQIDIPNYVTEISEKEQIQGFNIYPNPVDTNLNFRFNDASIKQLDVKIYDLNGKTLFSNQISDQSEEHSINIESIDLQSGMYFLELKTPTKSGISNFIVK